METQQAQQYNFTPKSPPSGSECVESLLVAGETESREDLCVNINSFHVSSRFILALLSFHNQGIFTTILPNIQVTTSGPVVVICVHIFVSFLSSTNDWILEPS